MARKPTARSRSPAEKGSRGAAGADVGAAVGADVEAMVERFMDGAARICRIYGVSPLLGRLYAVLFLSAAPLSLDELARRAGAAKSSVSVSLRQLVHVRVIRRVERHGDRRDYYEAVGNPWAVVAEWTRHFLQPELDLWTEISDDAVRTLERAGPRDERALLARLHAWRELLDVVGVILNDVPRRAARGSARAVHIAIEGGS